MPLKGGFTGMAAAGPCPLLGTGTAGDWVATLGNRDVGIAATWVGWADGYCGGHTNKE